MRLGEMLVASGAISEDELVVARTRQVATGTRLGTSLIELGFLGADDLARALARQHGVPAALTRHLQDRDPELAERIPGEIARDLRALAVALSRGAGGVNLVVCFRDPEPDIIAAEAEAAGMPPQVRMGRRPVAAPRIPHQPARPAHQRAPIRSP